MPRLTIVVPLAVAVAILVGCGREEPLGPPEQAPPARVTTVVAGERQISETAEATGTVQAIYVAEIAPKIMARVKEVLVREGDRVRRGQVLVHLEDADLVAAVEQAQASLQQAIAHYEQAKTGLEIMRTKADVDVRQAREAVAAAKAQLEKVRTGPRPQQLKQAEDAVKIAKARLEQARQQLDLMKEGFRRQQKAQAEQAVRAAEQQLEQARSGLAEARAHLRTVQADYERIKNLYEQEVVPKQQLDHMELQLTSAKEQVRRAEAQVKMAEAALEQARQQKDLVFEGFRSQEIRQAEEAVRQAEAAYNQALQELDMAREGGRHEDVAAAEAQYKQAQQQLRAALAAQARVKLREEDVKNAKAAIAQARAGLKAARVMLSYAIIRAPFDGVITGRMVDPGDMANPGVPAIRVEDDSLYRLICSVPESQAVHLSLGQRVICVIEALQGARLTGVVSEIVPAADPASRTLTVKADLPHYRGLKTGLFGRMIFTVGSRKALLVPREAVVTHEGVTGVWTVRDGKAAFRVVKTGAATDGEIEILSGISAGDEVIVQGQEHLREGQPVEASRRLSKLPNRTVTRPAAGTERQEVSAR